MKVIKKIIVALIVFFLLNQLYKHHALLVFAEKHADQYLQLHKIKNCDVIYFSASSNFPPENIEEKDPRKISQFIADHYPNLRFDAVNKPASHAAMYLALLEMLPENAEAKRFIITMNLRSFGPSWINSDLESALSQSSVFYNKRPVLFNRFLVSLNAYDQKSTVERQELVKVHWNHDQLPFEAPKNTVTSWCAVEKWGDWRNPKRQLADQYIKQFGFVIDEQNPRVKDFDAICNLANERGFQITFNLLAENMETADSLIGTDLTSLMKRNAKWLVERYENKGFTVVNNLEVLGAEHFTDKNFPTEHYFDTGRKTIAKNVAEALRYEPK
ncbi:MAG: hypothetical protein WEC59_12175 [Salibacteraceae bacterium]